MVQRNPRRPFIWLVVVLTIATACVVGLSACSTAKAPIPASSTARTASSPRAAAAPVTTPRPGTSASSPSAPTAAASTPAQVIQPTAASLPPVPVATNLAAQTLAGKDLPTASWTTAGVTLSFRAPVTPGAPLVPEVEVVKAGQPFTGQPTNQGAPIGSSGGQVAAQIPLKDLAPGQ
ncbi:MAG TPA: hypothetical protein VMW65_09260, partial [Chloroflexota bacterium]|nr:hypothetical protein [Chloroflexota bacterium]